MVLPRSIKTPRGFKSLKAKVTLPFSAYTRAIDGAITLIGFLAGSHQDPLKFLFDFSIFKRYLVDSFFDATVQNSRDSLRLFGISLFINRVTSLFWVIDPMIKANIGR